MASILVNHALEVPKYEVDPIELDFANSVKIIKVNKSFGNLQFHCMHMILPSHEHGTFCIALWRRTKVAVKKLGDDVIINEEKVRVVYEPCAEVVCFCNMLSRYLIYLCSNRKAFRDEPALS